MKLAALVAMAMLVPQVAHAQQLFDSHVHLWHGQRSLREYEAQTKGLREEGFGGMWFRSPNQALAGDRRASRRIMMHCWPSPQNTPT
jgi:hypothetical protein